MLKHKKVLFLVNNSYLFLFLASGVIDGEGFWIIDTINTDTNIYDDKSLLECHRKELIGYSSAKDIINAININVDNIVIGLKKKNFPLDNPPKGIPFDMPLNLLENIFDYWLEKYKDQEEWNTCFGLLKTRKRISLSNLINNNVITGKSKRWAIEIENLHNYEPNSTKKIIHNDPMWK